MTYPPKSQRWVATMNKSSCLLTGYIKASNAVNLSFSLIPYINIIVCNRHYYSCFYSEHTVGIEGVEAKGS